MKSVTESKATASPLPSSPNPASPHLPSVIYLLVDIQDVYVGLNYERVSAEVGTYQAPPALQLLPQTGRAEEKPRLRGASQLRLMWNRWRNWGDWA